MMIKRLLMGSLLVSSVASISAMNSEPMINDHDQPATERMSFDDELLMTEEASMKVEPTIQDAEVAQDSMVLSEEPLAPLRKKVSVEVEKPGQESLEIKTPEMSLETEVTLEKSPAQDEVLSITEDAQVVPEQSKSDVHGVFEAMTREEEDESFPG